MAKSKAPRKKYRPMGHILKDPMAFVKDGFRPMEDVEGSAEFNQKIKLNLFMSLDNLQKGEATEGDMARIIVGADCSLALSEVGKMGTEYAQETRKAIAAAVSIIERQSEIGKYLARGEELTILKETAALLDQQLSVTTLDNALKSLKYLKNNPHKFSGVRYVDGAVCGY